MFEEYAAVKPLDPWEIGQYLKRIGYTGSREPVKETLDALIYAHQCSVPFETLDPHDFGITVDLHPDAVFDKIVRKGRGGYCLELNGSFYRLLISLGFEVRPCLCRVLLGTEEWTHPIDHRTNLVTVGGRTYFCDVGVGGPMPPPGQIGRHAKQFPPQILPVLPGNIQKFIIVFCIWSLRNNLKQICSCLALDFPGYSFCIA